MIHELASLRRIGPAILAGLSLMIAGPALAAGNLFSNSDFSQRDPQGLPVSWSLWLPEVKEAACDVRGVPGGLLIDAPGKPHAVGGARQTVTRIEGGKAYAIEAHCTAENISSPFRSVLVRLHWTKAGKPLHPAGMYVRPAATVASTPGKLVFQDAFVAPPEADGATLSLEVKWPQGGSVRWEQVTLAPTSPPVPRKAKIGTVYLRPRGSTPEKNLELFSKQIDEAGRLGLDILCLGECITAVGTRVSGPQSAEKIPGPSTERLGAAAKKNKLWVVAGLYERDGQTIYNTAVLLDRQGRLAGKYRKIHLPREEWEKGVTPGHEYPVFKTDFGTIAIQICYDWFFPEVAEIFALRGAEVVFAPTWGTTFADKEGKVEGENVFRVRARDNGIYLVPSVYDGNSMVIDPLGRILASNQGRDGVFWAEVDLNQREPLDWVGHWRSIGPRDRMPETYRTMTDKPAAN